MNLMLVYWVAKLPKNQRNDFQDQIPFKDFFLATNAIGLAIFDRKDIAHLGPGASNENPDVQRAVKSQLQPHKFARL